jgi:flagellar biosynthetic protein FlhB
MAEQELQERTERATPKRLEEARRKGQLARSRELNATAVMLAGSGALLAFGPHLVQEGADLFRATLRLERAALFQPEQMGQSLAAALIDALLALAPILGACATAAILAPLAVGGWTFSLEALSFKAERLDPIQGLRRMASLRNLLELGKAIAKFLLVATASVLLLRALATEIMGLGREPLRLALAHGAHLCALALVVLSAVLIVIAAIDVPFQLWDHARRMRMTREELREEVKETEGRPEVRSRIRALQQQLARRRMMQEVPKADVVVTNPTHYAVALRYDQARMRAPRVVAKGADLMALQIRQVALAHGVPVYEAPPLARALHAGAEIDQEIPAGLYVAVAQLLAWVYALKRAVANGAPPPPRPQLDLPAGAVPDGGAA